MAKPMDTEDKGESFDLDKFRKLLQLMEKFGVTEVALQNEEESWKIRRGPRQVAYAPAAFPAEFAAAAAPAAQAAPVAAALLPAAPESAVLQAARS